MVTTSRGIGSETASVMLFIAGAAGYLLEPAHVARLLTLFVVYLGVRDTFAPPRGRAPRTLVLAVGIWAAISAYGFFGFDFLNAWPLLIVLIGISVIIQSFVAVSRQPSQTEQQ